MLGLFSLLILILIPAQAYAMPEVLTTVGSIMVSTGFFAGWGAVLIVIGTIWGGEEAKRAAKEREDAAKRKYNDSLKDRTATVISSEQPHRYIYGRARVGSAIVAALSSGARDEYKHLVCIHAAHECDAIEEIYINGKALGTLDGSGYVTSGDYYTNSSAQKQDYFSGTGTTLSFAPITGTLRVIGTDNTEYPYTLIGNVVSVSNTGDYYANYSYNNSYGNVRVLKHLGLISQLADTTLISEVPGYWDSTKTLNGLCYTIITLNLNFADFQSGCPAVEALIRGKKLHDVRSVSYPNDTPVWSQNNALMIADYLTSEMCGVPWTDLPLADFIAAANVCDEVTAYGARYNANGTVDADQSQSQVIEKMAQSMAGTVCATTWGCKAGTYVAPVMSLSQSDIVGDMSYTAGTAEADLYNGVKGQYISAENLYVATDFAPYQNSTYVTADGSELWTDVSFMFTDTKQRVHNICRVFTEDQRNGFTINAAFSYKTWGLQIGDRIAFTSEFMGQTAKVYRIIKKSYSPDSAVNITMKEDAASIWDLADAVTEDSTPNTNLTNPFVVPAPTNLQVTEELYQTTGSAGVKTKAIITWNNITSGILEYEFTYKNYYESFYSIKINSVSERIDIFDISDGKYDCKVRARNYLDKWSEYSTPLSFEIFGLNILPADVTGFTVKPFNGMALCNWDRTTDLDVKIGGDVVIRFCPLITGATFVQSVILPDGEYNGDASSAYVSLATGTYYIQFKDSTGNFSLNPASFVATESLVTGWTTVNTSTQHTTYTGTKTNCIATDNILKLDSVTLFDSLGLIDDVGYIDSIGGVSPLGIYYFNSTMDLTTTASRRFHAHIKSLVYNAADLIDDRFDFIDAWPDFDGGIINGVTATTYISTSNDDIIYGNWVPFMVADFYCRYAKFKLELTSDFSTHNIDISELEVKAKVPT